jgi:predicted nucleic acid-binding protein
LSSAFVDSSALIAVTFSEPGAGTLESLLRAQEALFACELLVAEFLSAARRESLAPGEAAAALTPFRWVIPGRSLRPEIDRVLAAGYLRGADLWHLACACYLAPNPQELAFVTRDEPQRKVAVALGFQTP